MKMVGPAAVPVPGHPSPQGREWAEASGCALALQGVLPDQTGARD
jgi:hypothetical protein